MNKGIVTDTIAKLESLALPEAKERCWLEHTVYGFHNEDYCYDCADIAYQILINREFHRLQRHHPLWYDCTAGNLYILPDDMSDSDGCSICEHCGAILDIELTDCGIDSELSHFEYQGFAAGCRELLNDYRHFIDILYEVECIETTWYPSKFTSLEEYNKTLSFYNRAVKLISTIGLR